MSSISPLEGGAADGIYQNVGTGPYLSLQSLPPAGRIVGMVALILLTVSLSRAGVAASRFSCGEMFGPCHLILMTGHGGR